MKIIELEQNTAEWLKFRESHITATDVSAIIGVNPWKKQEDVWKEKMGLSEPIVQNERMRRGTLLEPEARQILIEKTGIDFKPIVAVHDTETWAMASLDAFYENWDSTTYGYTHRKCIIGEIKCPNLDTHQLALSGGIKEYYMSQIQWQLWVTDAEKCYYLSYSPDQDNMEEIAIVEVMPDLEYIKQIVETCKKFYNENLCGFKKPEAPESLKMRNL